MVSLSPTADSSAEELLQYDSGWAATNRLLRAGSSFSGRERNCCFLNLGGKSQRFANVSAATGLDLIDDGRGLAVCDWDHDGRLDFWITNRTGPRVRFLHNQLASDNHYVALRLQGVGSNRDAIGARVELYLNSTTSAQPDMIKTLYGGSGYLSQSSKWLHFGIGNAAAISRVIVRWPGGEAESFGAVAADSHHLLVQGSGAATANAPAPMPAIASSGAPVAEPPPTSAARVVLLKPTPMPALQFSDASGKQLQLDSLRGKPVLLNLWATWCGNCLAEMAAWGAAQDTFSAAGVQVLSLCADKPSGDPDKDLNMALEKARGIAYPLPVGFSQPEAIELLNALQKNFIGRQADLPLPSSFLIDADGRLAVIYKGPVSPGQIATDARLLGAGADAIVAGAVPFPGNWLEIPHASEPRSVAVSLVENGLRDEAARYLLQIIPLYQQPVPGADKDAEETRLTELAECHTFLGAILFDQEQFEQAANHYQTALAVMPGRRKARQELVRTLTQLGRKKEAVSQLLVLLESRRDPDTLIELARLYKGEEVAQPDEAIARFEEALKAKESPDVRNELANLLRDQGKKAQAAANYRAVLKDRPNSPVPANNLAWILATDPDPAIRNGEDAIRFAKFACAATNNRVPQFHGTLAAAYAEIADFKSAVIAIQRAIELAKEYKETDLARRLEEKLRLYQSGQPFRDA